MKKELYKETGYPGIKQRISDNMYIVTIDLGRQLRLNKKTGLIEMKQAKTTKHVTTLKEAKELLGKNNKEKKLCCIPQSLQPSSLQFSSCS